MLKRLEQAAIEAGLQILAIAAAGAGMRVKADQTPVTDADEAAEALILKALARDFPDIPVVAEEEAAAGRLPSPLGERFFLVDALDGTKEFIAGRPDYTVNIACVENGMPIAGVVFSPARLTLYSGAKGRAEKITVDDKGRERSRAVICTRPPEDQPVALASRSHDSAETQACLARLRSARCVSIGSSLKFCLLAEGEADVYPRYSPTMQWDTAAGDAVLRAAGGVVEKLDCTPLTYGLREDGSFANPFFIAWGQPQR